MIRSAFEAVATSLTAPGRTFHWTAAREDAAGSVTFFFPYREVSGVPVIFSRLALHLAQCHRVDTRVVDYPDGYMARTLAGTPVRLLSFTPGAYLHIGADTVFVTQSLLPYTLRRELRFEPNTRMLLWTLHPLNWVPPFLPFNMGRHSQAAHPWSSRLLLAVSMPRLRRGMIELLRHLDRTSSLAFMDRSTFRSTCELLGVSLPEPSILPVPCEVPPANRKAASGRGLEPDELSMAWLGRVADFKVHILLRAVRDLSDAAHTAGRRLTVHIIGTGSHERLLERHLPAAVHVVRPGVLTGAELEAYLLARVDLLVAMGASALEGGRLGVPTILLDPFYGPVPARYRYRWFYESSGWSLGEFVPPFTGPRRPMEALLSQLTADFAGVSERTYTYCRQYHAVEEVAARFLQSASAANFRYSEFRPIVLQRGLLRKAYERLRGIP